MWNVLIVYMMWMQYCGTVLSLTCSLCSGCSGSRLVRILCLISIVCVSGPKLQAVEWYKRGIAELERGISVDLGPGTGEKIRLGKGLPVYYCTVQPSYNYPSESDLLQRILV